MKQTYYDPKVAEPIGSESMDDSKLDDMVQSLPPVDPLLDTPFPFRSADVEQGDTFATENNAGPTQSARTNVNFLPPHQSLFDALQSSNLNMVEEIDPLRRSNQPEECSPSCWNQEFSVTAWQMVHRDDVKLQNLWTHTKMYGTGSRRVPGTGNGESVLSSSEYEETDLPDTPLLNEDDIEERNEHDTILMIAEDENLKDTATVSSGRQSSFVMPKVSLPDSGASNSKSISWNGKHARIKVQVVGNCAERLLARLIPYRKTLWMLDFVESGADILVLLLNKDNVVLPRILNKPFLPIIIKDDDAEFSSSIDTTSLFDNYNTKSTARSSSSSIISEPLELKSIDDDLFDIIHALSNMELDFCGEESFQHISTQTSTIASSKQARSRRSSSRLAQRRKLHKQTQMSQSREKRSHQRCSYEYINWIRRQLTLGLTLGLISISYCIWSFSSDHNKLHGYHHMNGVWMRCTV
ncbi:Hypothetical protein PP7435_CHR4-0680 [Komagataella phaffii CBS 7435]|uniref:Uncharacterized protein n=2 Tax=Komagataella phaffii TaxID=460519 RepID=C4R7I1_KOMPG|nr:uncharacterized protein PAS_chr4_0945 [Komagataella phaffii GS115]AOA65238.1 GQ67_04651T0 [Komagataella phaffii]CAH2451070.1 Hypothetical protein BQ9382_C4-3585 [Komagataella phaffii CBS 7435]AOA69700.1 GQ68_04623T0 [Komagataella phaffii GS115]CAY71556.1 hypothetical protein PAS_chr4_0945 [Komagataella phaffii GS115]CCA40838.1 Hypothetical protein PP7435_CHR4-0680 [Komagataella phaffii CBS 7435]